MTALAPMTARQIMTSRPEVTTTDATVVEAARRMRDLHVASLPVCDGDDRLAGMVSDRDIVVRSVAAGDDPRVTTIEALVTGHPVTVDADDSVEDALCTMIEHAVRRLPVVDQGRLVGMVSQADVARSLPQETIGRLIASISRPH